MCRHRQPDVRREVCQHDALATGVGARRVSSHVQPPQPDVRACSRWNPPHVRRGSSRHGTQRDFPARATMSRSTSQQSKEYGGTTMRWTPENETVARAQVLAVVVGVAGVLATLLGVLVAVLIWRWSNSVGEETSPGSAPVVTTAVERIPIPPTPATSASTTAPLSYIPLYEPTDLELTDPGYDGAFIDITVPRVYVNSDEEVGHFIYRTAFGFTENTPVFDTVKPAVAAYLANGNPTAEACAASVDQKPIDGLAKPPATGQSICIRLSSQRVAALVVTSQDPKKTNRLGLRVMAWELR